MCMRTVRREINSCFFHLFFTHSTDCSYLCLGLTPSPLHTLYISTSPSQACIHTQTHISWGDVRVSIHSVEASCTPGDSPGWWCWLRSGCAGRGGERWVKGPTGCPSGTAQPAHSSSFSSRASAGMSLHVRDHCLKGGFPMRLKRPFKKINRDGSRTCSRCVQVHEVCCRMCTSTHLLIHSLKIENIASAFTELQSKLSFPSN